MNRRFFLSGLIAAAAAPAIIRPGLLMPIKPSLVPDYRLVQIGVDVNFTTHEVAMPLFEFNERHIMPALRALAAEIEANALVPHNERPKLESFMGGRYVGELREVEFYDSRRATWGRRYDGLFRDYRADRVS